MVTPPFLDQDAFQGRGDTVGLNSATFDHALNTNWSQLVDTVFRVRFVLQETNGVSTNLAYLLRYSHNGGAYTIIDGTTPVATATSSQFTDRDATSQVIGAGSFVAGEGDDNNLTGLIALNAQETEIEFSLTIDSTQAANGDTIALRIYRYALGTAIDSYTNTPTITVNNPAPPATRRIFVVT